MNVKEAKHMKLSGTNQSIIPGTSQEEHSNRVFLKMPVETM
jgi:hypothetical protein